MPKLVDPKAGATAVADEMDLIDAGLGAVRLPQMERRLKPIPGLVIYLGSNDHESVCLTGIMAVEAAACSHPLVCRHEPKHEVAVCPRPLPQHLDGTCPEPSAPELRTPLEEGGHESYDFSSLDNRRRPNAARHFKAPEGHPYHHRNGRIFLRIDHPVHLYEMSIMRTADGSPKFEVLALPQYQAELQQFFAERARINRTRAQEQDEVIKNQG